jgi:ABC-2 type transport system permease protein
VPLSAMPGWVRHVAPASPGYWAVSALKAALAGNTPGTLRAGAVLAGIAVAFGLFAAVRAGRSAARSTRM